jgi:flagellar biosynthesis/type III secretory pathway protein FliH
MVHVCNPSYIESIGRRIVVKDWPGQKQDPTWKLKNAKRNRVVAQMVECLLSKCEALSSNCSITTKKEKGRKEQRKEGIEKGRERGREAGRKEGRENRIQNQDTKISSTALFQQ